MERNTKIIARQGLLTLLLWGAGMLCAGVQAHEPSEQAQSGAAASESIQPPGLLQRIRQRINTFLVESRTSEDAPPAEISGYGVGYESRMAGGTVAGGLGDSGGGGGGSGGAGGGSGGGGSGSGGSGGGSGSGGSGGGSGR